MRIVSDEIRLAATDVSNHLACHHLTNLERSVARGDRAKPDWEAPDLAVIRERGLRHEAAYLEFLGQGGSQVLNLAGERSEKEILEGTRRAMELGVEVIAQGALRCGRWFGQPDILRKVEKTSRFGSWSYEVYDCKLARETKATTILQLAFYSELLGQIQGTDPEHMYVVPTGKGFQPEPYRVAEYAAYYRHVKKGLETACEEGEPMATYPEPCVHCDVCQWFRECDARRRGDDHLSLVAGITRLQRKQLEDWKTETVAKLAVLPVPLEQKPLHGSKEGMEKVREQARMQVAGRMLGKPVYELLRVAEGNGFCRLPEPSLGDVFVDLEGDPFAGGMEAGGGLEYLFGFVTANRENELRYEKRWALTKQEEKEGFEWLVDEIVKRWKESPAMHIYHFGGYEPGAFKRLMGRYTTREEEVDGMLRAELFVDLHTVFKQAVRASVEEYSLKKLEVFYGFERKMPLEKSLAAMRFIERRLELGWDHEELPDKFREVMQGYNAEDCFSTAALRNWLEAERQKLMDAGVGIARPEVKDGTPSEAVKERGERVAQLIADLTQDLPIDTASHGPADKAGWLLAQLLDWHRREHNATCWEYFRLAAMDDDDLMAERSALAGLKLVKRTLAGRKLAVDTYSFVKQDTDVRKRDKVGRGRLTVGRVESIDLGARTVDIKKTGESLDIHPSSIFVDGRGPGWDVLADAAFRLGIWVKENSVDGAGRYRATRDLLLNRRPSLRVGESVEALGMETTVETACRIVDALEESVFAIQGPPGAGKTFNAARMICKLVQAGKKVGVTALSHKVISKVLKEIQVAADEAGIEVQCIQKIREEGHDEEIEGVETTKKNEVPLLRLNSRKSQVAAGTVWMWARPEYIESVDALFIDEAGQMALADVVAAGQAAKNLILIGDPQQLQRPLKGKHPEEAQKSALEHLIGDRKTILPEMGMLLPQTRRMHPSVCEFTSEVFYEQKLSAHPVTHCRVLEGHRWLKGAGLWFVPVEHEGNCNSSAEEVEAVARIVDSLLKPKVKWFYGIGNSRALKREKDILVVAPYNAQVSDLSERLPGMLVGTVDKFQGQEAPVVIYSLTTSSPEDAPRGMEFLYSLNRFNVATSRAMTAVIVVGSPKLFEPECKSPRQMQLANAFCAYLERATVVDLAGK